ncbi:bifunctional diaminohydroxyphosphoribosylaminopyrimidine deaminase/5-amino-6-(5-phosphoribosylamino)uracil reductase RibD [Candidatus Woesearchaeota archaeon]|nr:bifunctional diaminohydroxyphosphoribosylaminopyrimidine deaminase/5-amino-6-(5-phosphoribosylamino)uracil reductase RibD [Candidatus Woesearchaeota archaeon]
MADKERFMKRCLELARKGRTSPNPMVGCVIARQGRIIAEGYHEKAGGPHAEVQALKKAGKKARGAVMYANLEPCCHHGKTPPCTDAIIKAGIKNVVCAMRDPNPRVSGEGIRQLKAAGIRVELGLMEKQAKRLNEAFLRYIPSKMPFVLMKAAVTLDGRIATSSGDSRWVSNEASRRTVHRLRDRYDAVLVGIGTVLKDNPRLTCRIREGNDPIRIIVDSKLRIPLDAEVLADDNVMIAATEACDSKKKARLEARGIGVTVVNSGRRVDLYRLMQMLGELRIISVLVEGGAGINASALEAGIVDKVMFFIAPKMIIRGKPVTEGKGPKLMKDALQLNRIRIRMVDDDLLYEAYLK